MSKNRLFFAVLIVVAAIAVDYGREFENAPGDGAARVGYAADATINPAAERGTGLLGWLGRAVDGK